MPADNSRIQELRRRVDKDPASIVFAQLAEEYRRAGDPEEAVRVCRAGLVQHPTYVSARVTLGRSLMELGKLEEARGQFEQVLAVAPDNLVAVRSMAELYQLRGDTAPTTAGDAAGGPPPLPDLPLPLVVPPPLPIVEDSTAPAAAALPSPVPSEPPIDLDAAIAAFNVAFSPAAPPEPVQRVEPVEPVEPIEPVEPPEPPEPPEPVEPPNPPAAELESWLANIVADRDQRNRNS